MRGVKDRREDGFEGGGRVGRPMGKSGSGQTTRDGIQYWKGLPWKTGIRPLPEAKKPRESGKSPETKREKGGFRRDVKIVRKPCEKYAPDEKTIDKTTENMV